MRLRTEFTVRAIFAYYDLILVIDAGVKCYLQCVNYFDCSLHLNLLLNVQLTTRYESEDMLL
jgi:hypothetical protein